MSSDVVGLAEPSVACRCETRISTAKARGYVNPNPLLFANRPKAELSDTAVARTTIDFLAVDSGLLCYLLGITTESLPVSPFI